jgi:hypothetical protein
MNSRIASKFAVYPAPSNTVELALHAPPPPRAAPSRSSGPRPSTYLVCLERMPAEPDQATKMGVSGHRRREERKPVGSIGSWGAGTSENNRLASKQPNRPHLSISTCRPAKLRLLPGPPCGPALSEFSSSLRGTAIFCGAPRFPDARARRGERLGSDATGTSFHVKKFAAVVLPNWRREAAKQPNRGADSAWASREYSSSRRKSRRPSRGMDWGGILPQDPTPEPGIALAWRSRSLKRPVGRSRTMHRHRHRCWSKTFRSARMR